MQPLGWRERLARMLEFQPRELAALALLVVVVVGGAVFGFARSLPKPAEPATAADATLAPVETPAEPSDNTAVYVHVAGAVRSPGVYELPSGSRVADALRAAGGATADADANSINLARPCTDGERIYVPRRGETPPPDSGGGSGPGGGAAGGKININLASASQLEELPGIGPSLAQRIVDYRDKHGAFKTIRDLMKVQGIGEKKFAALEEYVTV